MSDDMFSDRARRSLASAFAHCAPITPEEREKVRALGLIPDESPAPSSIGEFAPQARATHALLNALTSTLILVGLRGGESDDRMYVGTAVVHRADLRRLTELLGEALDSLGQFNAAHEALAAQADNDRAYGYREHRYAERVEEANTALTQEIIDVRLANVDLLLQLKEARAHITTLATHATHTAPTRNTASAGGY